MVSRQTAAHMPVAPSLGRLLRGDPRLLARALARLDAVQIAAQLDNLDSSDQRQVMQLLPVERRPEVLEAMRFESAAELIRVLAPEEAATLLDELDSDDAADILQRLDPSSIRAIGSRLDPADVGELEELLTYEPNTAGGIMSPDFVAIHDNVSVAEVVRFLQKEAEDLPEDVFDVYVLDASERLVGAITLRALVISAPDVPVRDVMDKEVLAVEAETDQEIVADIASRYDLVTVPVIDRQQRMLGVVTIDDIVDVLREEATEDILKMAGAGEMLADTRYFAQSLRTRLPWLMGAAVGGLLVAISLSGFEASVAAVPALAAFMPIVAGMGGNIGTQSSTIIVRGLAVGYVERGAIGRIVVREVMLALVIGLLSGAMVSLIAPYAGIDAADPVRLGLVVTGGLMGSMAIAATVGTLMPLALEAANVDPAVATGPFVTTAVDILGLLFYFALATWLMGLG